MLPENMYVIGDYAFRGCTALTSAVIGNAGIDCHYVNGVSVD